MNKQEDDMKTWAKKGGPKSHPAGNKSKLSKSKPGQNKNNNSLQLKLKATKSATKLKKTGPQKKKRQSLHGNTGKDTSTVKTTESKSRQQSESGEQDKNVTGKDVYDIDSVDDDRSEVEDNKKISDKTSTKNRKSSKGSDENSEESQADKMMNVKSKGSLDNVIAALGIRKRRLSYSKMESSDEEQPLQSTQSQKRKSSEEDENEPQEIHSPKKQSHKRKSSEEEENEPQEINSPKKQRTGKNNKKKATEKGIKGNKKKGSTQTEKEATSDENEDDDNVKQPALKSNVKEKPKTKGKKKGTVESNDADSDKNNASSKGRNMTPQAKKSTLNTSKKLNASKKKQSSSSENEDTVVNNGVPLSYSIADTSTPNPGSFAADSARTTTSEFSVWIVLNSAGSSQSAVTLPVLHSIEHINQKSVTCSTTWLRSLFSTLLTLNHVVLCELDSCDITSCLEGLDICTETFITTDLNNTLNMQYFGNYSPGLWEALHGLNIKSLSLSGGLRVNHVKSLSQSLSSLKQLETIGINVSEDRNGSSDTEDSPYLWEALHGLTIKSLSLIEWYICLRGNHVESLSQSLSSLTQLDTLSISVLEDSSDLWDALRGLNIKILSLSGGFRMEKKESLSQSLSSLSQLETLSIRVDRDSPALWEALCNLNIKSLSLSLCGSVGESIVYHVESVSQSLSSLTQLETLTIYVNTYIVIQLPQSLKFFNFNCHELHPSELRDLLNTMSVCTQTVEIRLKFGCTSFGLHPTPKEYIDVQHKLGKLENVIVKRFLIYDRRPRSDMWSVRDIRVVADIVHDIDDHDDDRDDNEDSCDENDDNRDYSDDDRDDNYDNRDDYDDDRDDPDDDRHDHDDDRDYYDDDRDYHDDDNYDIDDYRAEFSSEFSDLSDWDDHDDDIDYYDDDRDYHDDDRDDHDDDRNDHDDDRDDHDDDRDDHDDDRDDHDDDRDDHDDDRDDHDDDRDDHDDDIHDHDDDSVDNNEYICFLRNMSPTIINRISMRLQIIPSSIL